MRCPLATDVRYRKATAGGCRVAERLPFTKRQRVRWSQHGVHRPTTNFGSGTLPSPWAATDIVRVPDGAMALERMHDGMKPGFYVIDTAFSIDEGDAWYFRITDGVRVYGHERSSDRLHVARPEPFSTGSYGADWMAGIELVDTLDPDGLARRDEMIRAGWALVRGEGACSWCHGSGLSQNYSERLGVWRVQQRRVKGWRKPPGAVSVARPGRFGNPFVGPTAAADFRRAIDARASGAHVPELLGYPTDAEIVAALRGRLIMCFCAVGADCHGDTLAEIANR